MKKVIFTQKQLDEVIGGDFQYLKNNTTGMGQRGNAEISTTPAISDEEHGEPITTDEFGSKIAPNRRFGYIGASKVGITCSKENKKKVVTESNSDLENKKYKIPDEIYTQLKLNLQQNQNNKTAKGYKRLVNLIKNRYITTNEMYRLKNFFMNNDENSEEFNLIGGVNLKNWIERQLNVATSLSHQSKKIKKDMGQNNAFIKSHNKTCGNNGAHSSKNNVEITYE